MFAKLESFLGPHAGLSVDQVTDAIETYGYIETANKYRILDKDGEKWGFMAEKGQGLLATLLRNCLRNRRPMRIGVHNRDKEEVILIKRPFYLFYSRLDVFHGRHKIGSVRRRFSVLYSRYDIRNRGGKVIGRIRSKYLSHRFPVLDSREKEIGIINKNFGGFDKEILTDADNFFVNFPSHWSNQDKALLLGAIITIDMDFFEKGSHEKRV